MQCLYVARTTNECLLRGGVHLWEDKNAVFVCGWDPTVSVYGRLKMQRLYVAGTMTVSVYGR